MSKRSIRNDLDDEDDFIPHKGIDTLRFCTKVKRAYQHDVFIDQPFLEASYYRNVVAMLNDASEQDIVIFHINSPGGLMSGLESLLEAVKTTEAHTVAYLVGECASAASIFAMYCDAVIVSDLASIMIHNVSYGTSGKNSDIIAHTRHVAKTSEKLIRETYEFFLSADEIDEVLNGREIYLDADECKKRFDYRAEMQNAQNQEAASSVDIPLSEEVQPSIKSPKKTKQDT